MRLGHAWGALWPALGIAAALLVINASLYGPLAPRGAEPPIGAPAGDGSGSGSASSCAYATSFEALYGWLPFSGDWARADGGYVQRVPFGFDRGAGMARFRAGDRYTLSVRMRYISGVMGGGLAFNMERPYAFVNSQLVRFAGGKGLLWGYYDEKTGFHTMGGAALPEGMDAGDGHWHTLRLTVRPETFDIAVDESEIARDQPLRFTAGYFSLHTSESAVAFDDLCLGWE
ncbi:MAG: hypothetical protein C4311_06595 [Chloroflexota bacterium]